MNEFQADQFQRARRVQVQSVAGGRPRLALIAFALGLAAWALPLLPVVVLILGGLAWVGIKRSATQGRAARGKGLATAALALGAVGLGMQGYVGYETYQHLHAGPTQVMASDAPKPIESSAEEGAKKDDDTTAEQPDTP